MRTRAPRMGLTSLHQLVAQPTVGAESIAAGSTGGLFAIGGAKAGRSDFAERSGVPVQVTLGSGAIARNLRGLALVLYHTRTSMHTDVTLSGTHLKFVLAHDPGISPGTHAMFKSVGGILLVLQKPSIRPVEAESGKETHIFGPLATNSAVLTLQVASSVLLDDVLELTQRSGVSGGTSASERPGRINEEKEGSAATKWAGE